MTDELQPVERLPQIEDLFYVALEALSKSTKPTHFGTIDEAALDLTEFNRDSARDTKLMEQRLGFARSALKRVGAASNPRRGFWAITETGRSYLENPEGRGVLTSDINASYSDRTADAGFLQSARDKADSPAPLRMTVRELIGQWKVTRRGAAINEQIRQDLETLGLRTDPDFATTWIDGPVTIVSAGGGAAPERPPLPDQPTGELFDDITMDDISMTVGSIKAANVAVEAVKLNTSLIHAQSLMMRYDFSQLAVISGKQTVRGAVTWESIAQERLRNPDAELVSECRIDATIVRPESHLLDIVPTVVDQGFVFVQKANEPLAGIVTMADLSLQFASLANPFVLLGELEGWLGRALDGTFDRLEISAAANPNDAERHVETAADLTLGEMIRMIDAPPNWDRLGWGVERRILVEGLHDVRRIRNDFMHFSTDPVTDADLETLRHLLVWIRYLLEPR